VLSIIAATDFILVFAVIMLSRFVLDGVFPRWYVIAATSFFWALCSVFSRKLQFWYFAKSINAYATIVIVDVAIYVLSFIVWLLLFPERGILLNQLWPLPLLILIECSMYQIWYHLFHKVPYLYVDVIERPMVEPGIENACHYLDSDQRDKDLSRIYEATAGMNRSEFRKWISDHRDQFSPDTLVLDICKPRNLMGLDIRPKLIICLQAFNKILHLNTFLRKANDVLSDGGTIVLLGETSNMRKHRIISKYPPIIGHIAVVADYFLSHVILELSLMHKYTSFIAKAGNVNMPRVEVLGRIARAGFDICGDEMRADYYLVSAVRAREAAKNKPHYGLFVRLPRRGENGKMIGVFKLRTMYAYSEYIQDYSYRINGLEKGGKLKNDFRINVIGRFCRSRFIDELPMFLNYLHGDLKLVGVRPLSEHYLSLYTPQMREMHLSVKPGIFPPLYYEYPKPETIEQIQESERRYIEKYRKNPSRTDREYFRGIMRNILFRREKSH